MGAIGAFKILYSNQDKEDKYVNTIRIYDDIEKRI